LDTEGITNKFW